MNRLITAFIVGGLLWYGFTRYQSYTHDPEDGETSRPAERATELAKPLTEGKPGRFSCDGRKYCSEMTSCEEAKYFLAHCPGVEMDGDRNGIPCERQLCAQN
jgi:hypothetical protein